MHSLMQQFEYCGWLHRRAHTHTNHAVVIGQTSISEKLNAILGRQVVRVFFGLPIGRIAG